MTQIGGTLTADTAPAFYRPPSQVSDLAHCTRQQQTCITPLITVRNRIHPIALPSIEASASQPRHFPDSCFGIHQPPGANLFSSRPRPDILLFALLPDSIVLAYHLLQYAFTDPLVTPVSLHSPSLCNVVIRACAMAAKPPQALEVLSGR